MYIIPREILFMSQVLGIFPMQYTINSRGEFNIEFSSYIFKWSFIFISLVSVGFHLTLFMDSAKFLSNVKSNIPITPILISALITTIPLSVMLVICLITAYRNYQKYIEMSQILERIDDTLQLKIDSPTIIFKLVFIFTFISAFIGIEFYQDFGKAGFICSVSYTRCFYYFQAILLLHFNFVVETITARFRMINEKIKEELLRQSLLQLTTDLALPNNALTYSGGLLEEERIEILIDSYYRLCEALEKACWFFDNPLFATMTCSFINNTISFYYFFYSILNLKEFSQINATVVEGAWAVGHLTHIILLLWPSTSLTDTVKETAQIVCQLISWDTNNAIVKAQLETFLYQLLHSDDIGFTGLGMFKIHGCILVSIASSVTTYLVIMLQF